MEKTIKNDLIKETLFINTLSSKLKCYIIPKTTYMEKQAILVTKYGAKDLKFMVNNKEFTTEAGSAHFLEHKIFKDEKIDIFNEFLKLKGNVNAYTNYDITAYYFNSIDNFYKNLELLFKFVFKIHLTEENIEKEKDIIEQEIKMYNDYPSFKCYFNMQKKMYNNFKMQEDIAGSVESIRKIDKFMLLECFNNFYNPSNMALICCGDVDKEKIYEIADKNTLNKKYKKVDKFTCKEEENVKSNYVEEKMSISLKIFNLGFKENNKDKQSKILKIATTKILLNIIAGPSSHLYENMYNKGLIDNTFSLDYICGLEHAFSIFSGASKDPKKVKDEIFKEIFKISKEGIDQNFFEQIKKKQLGRHMRDFNSLENTINLQADFFAKDENVFSLLEAFCKVDINMVEERLKSHLITENFTLSVISPI